MKSVFMKLLSLVLVAVLLVNMLPMSAFAQQVQEASTESATLSADAEVDFSEAEIVDELTEKRDAYSKTFRLDNGLHVAVSYSDPVHYETAKGWEEIDNTLTAQADGSYSNTAGKWDVHFPEYLNSGIVEIEKDGYKLSFSMSGELHSGKNRSAEAIQMARASAAQVRQQEPVQQEQEAYAVRKNRAQMQYADVYENTDIVYDLVGNSLKESVILSTYRSSLRGYRYTLNTGTMVPVLEENGQITLYDAAQKEMIMVMPAPYLVDADNAYNDDVQVQLTGSNGTYTLTYLLPQQWLAEQDRSWPVVLDPIVKSELDADNIRDRSVSSGGTSDQIDGQLDGTLDCGYNTKRGQQRFYVKYNQLPTMKSSETIVKAVMCLRTVETYNGKVPVTVHKVLDTWESETLTWNNQPQFSNIVEDYNIVGASAIYTAYEWNVTDIVRDWYSSENTGMMFQVPQSVIDQGTNSLRQFCSADYGHEVSRPTLFVFYRDTSGIESRYSYQTMSAGHAGSAYISDSTGQLTVVKQLASYGSTINPFALNLVYNSNFSKVAETATGSVQDVHGIDMQFGKGITWDMIQSIEEAELENAYGKYLVWHDGDGTDHYFLKQSDGTYLDEDGLKLKVEKSGDQHTMIDDQGNKWLFDKGLLYKYQDESGNTTVIQWQGSGSSRYFYRIYQQNSGATTGTDLVNVTYVPNTSYISSLTDAAGRVYQFQYDSGRLIGITMNGTPIARYDYQGNQIVGMQDLESSYWLWFTYEGGKVASYQEWIDSNTSGASVQITYYKDMTVYRDCGADRQFPSSDDLLTYYSFDYWGRTVNACTKDTQGKVLGTSTASYTQNKTDTAQQLRNNNRTLQTASTGMAAQNLLANSSFESDLSAWNINDTGTTASITASTYTHHSGNKSLEGYMQSGHSGTISIYCSQGLTAGKQYTFSAYVNTSWISSFGSNGGIRLLVSQPGGTQWESENLNYDTTGTDEGWARLSVSFTAGTSGNHSFMLQAWGLTGWFYADDFQLEQAEAPSNYNLIQNSNMETSAGWLYEGSMTFPTDTNTNSRVLSLQGSLQEDVCAWQNVKIMQPSSQTYVLSGWAWADSVPDNDSADTNENYAQDTTKRFGLQAILHYQPSEDTDEPDTEYHYVPFNPDVAGWQFTAMTIVPKQENRTVQYIQVVCAYEKNANSAWFDNLSLTMEAAQSMRYDAEGNLTSVTTTGLDKAESSYENGNLMQTQTGGFGTYEYTYDENVLHRLTSVTDGIVEQSYGYDSYGNANSTTLKNGDSTLRTSAVYTSKGNLLWKATDANGDMVEYIYNGALNTALGLPSSVTDGNGTTTYMGYDNFGRTQVSSIVNTARVEYTYSKGLLTNVIRDNDQIYSFTYDDWGNRTGVYAGNNRLASYTYAEKNGNLTSQEYGNGDTVSYTYDNLGRVKTATYSDTGRILTYTYTGDGQLYSIKDSTGNGDKTTYFNYDTLGRLISSRGDATRSSAAYNAYNQLIRQDFVSTLSSDYVTYTYDTDKENGISDGKLTAMKMVSGGIINYQYDGLQRLVHKHNTAGIWETFVYDNTQVSSKINYLGDTRLQTFQYTYDSNGNITREILSDAGVGSSRTYTYDNLNQLTGVTHSDGRTESYSYDSHGNITSFNNGSGKNYTFAYEDDGGWKDLLTTVTKNGQPHTITYDDAGNPTSYYDGFNYTFEWAEGRRLQKVTYHVDSTTNRVTEYEYDYTGLRTKKTNQNGTYTVYHVANGQYLGETQYGSDDIPDLYIRYIYDENNSVTGISLWYAGVSNSWINYYFVKNLQGDVLRVYNASDNSLVATYSYDAWGNVLSAKDANGNDALTTPGTVAYINPFRYRGYYFDQETYFYYLESRYYDPAIGRFINGDDLELLLRDYEAIIQYNLFAYCWNNPVKAYDPDGCWTLALAGGGYLATAGTIGATNAWNPAGWVVIGVVAVVAVSISIYEYSEHTSTKNGKKLNKHQEGEARRKRDQGGEKKKQKKDWVDRNRRRRR